MLSLIVHLTQDRIEGLVEAITFLAASDRFQPKSELMLSYIPSMKGMLFFASLLVLSLPLLEDLRKNSGVPNDRSRWIPILAALCAAVALGLLVFHPGSRSLGAEYARIAKHPFSQEAGIFNTRLLMPAIAHLLFFRGNWLYYAFSILLTVGFLALLYIWLKENCPLPFWQFLSMGTASFVIYQYQYAGSPDILVFLCFLLVMFNRTSQDSKLSLLLLALIAYESSVFLGVVLAWRYLTRGRLIAYLAAIGMYVLTWFVISGFDPAVILTSHDVTGESGLAWLLRYPDRELLGFLMSFKALWILLCAAIWLAWNHKKTREAGFIAATLGAAALMSVLAVDTSRLMGFAFPGLLVALSMIQQEIPVNWHRPFLTAVFLANLLIPSVYVGLNIGVVWSPGLYSYLYQSLFSAAGLLPAA